MKSKKTFSSGRMASGDLPLSQSHKYKISIMIYVAICTVVVINRLEYPPIGQGHNIIDLSTKNTIQCF